MACVFLDRQEVFMLHEQPGREQTREVKQASLNEQPGSTARANWIALGAGFLLSFLTANSVLSYLGMNSSDTSFPPWTAWLPFQLPYYFFLLLPLALGVIIPFTVGIQRKNLISFVVGRSLLVWVGVSIYWFPLAAYGDGGKWTQEARDACQRVNNHGFCGLHLGATGLFLYLVFSIIALLLLALITAWVMWIIKFFRKVDR
jgi:hypothetical protein